MNWCQQSPVLDKLTAPGSAARRIASLLLLASVFPVASAQTKKQLALEYFKRAEELRSELAARPTVERTRERYQRAIEAYRLVYHTAFDSSKADDSIFTAAELGTEMGRAFADEGSLRTAASQYQFLCREYPGSPFVAKALFAVAEIYRADLRDNDSAKAAYEKFLSTYPRHRLARQARLALVSLKGAPEPSTKTEAEVLVKQPQQLARVTGVRYWPAAASVRIAVDLEQEVKFRSQRVARPSRIVFDLEQTSLASHLLGKAFTLDNPLLRKIRVAQFQPGITRVVLEVGDVVDSSAFLLPNPYRLIIDLHGAGSEASAQAARGREVGETAAPEKRDTVLETLIADIEEKSITERIRPPENARTPKSVSVSAHRKTAAIPDHPRIAKPASNGEHSLIRALGLKMGKIVVDAGHGGSDTGTVGRRGVKEKDVVLDVALRLGKLLEKRLGAEVVYTREDDSFIPLEQRTAIANQARADLFISLHANSSRNTSARGIETYYLNFTSSEEALEVAARENAVSEKGIHELQDLVEKITLTDKIDESREFAAEVQRALYSGLSKRTRRLRDRGVKKAPFVVLIGAEMPSILAEISFLSNPADEKNLNNAKYRQRIAEALSRGIEQYVQGLSGVNLASRQTAGQQD
jgi:N-acetylmuramoyl-L-alanine amidase